MVDSRLEAAKRLSRYRTTFSSYRTQHYQPGLFPIGLRPAAASIIQQNSPDPAAFMPKTCVSFSAANLHPKGRKPGGTVSPTAPDEGDRPAG